jgi:hypothetical protein
VEERLERDVEAKVPHHLVGYFVVLVCVGHDVSAWVLVAEGVEVEAGFEEGSLELYLVGVDDSEGALFVSDASDARVLHDDSAGVFGVGMGLESYLVSIHR